MNKYKNRKQDMYNLTIKVGDKIHLGGFESEEYPNYCSCSKGVVKEIKNKYVFCELEARMGLTKVCPENLYLIDENGKPVATLEQRIKTKNVIVIEREENAKKVVSAPINHQTKNDINFKKIQERVGVLKIYNKENL